VFLNSVGQRIDQPLVKPSADVYKRLDDRCQRLPWPHKFCNMHHIKGACTHGNCQYSHTLLERDEVLVLAIRARQMMCKFGSACTYRLCFLGHHCSHDPNCQYRTCRFANFHGIDKRMTHVLLDGAVSRFLSISCPFLSVSRCWKHVSAVTAPKACTSAHCID